MKNQYEIAGNYAYILLQKGKYKAKISLCDLERVKEFPGTWRAAYQSLIGCYYVRGHIQVGEKWTTMQIHRWLLDITDFEIKIDHINHDGLDNSRENLNIVTNAENCQNAKAKGYCFREKSNKYETYINIDGKRIWLGSYDTEEKARIAYMEGKLRYHPYFRSITTKGIAI